MTCLLTGAALNMGCVSIDSNGNAIYSNSEEKSIDDDRVSANKAALSINCLYSSPDDGKYYEDEDNINNEESYYEETGDWGNDED